MADLTPESIKETFETASSDESNNFQKLGWLLIDTYKIDQTMYYVLAWVKDGAAARP